MTSGDYYFYRLATPETTGAINDALYEAIGQDPELHPIGLPEDFPVTAMFRNPDALALLKSQENDNKVAAALAQESTEVEAIPDHIWFFGNLQPRQFAIDRLIVEQAAEQDVTDGNIEALSLFFTLPHDFVSRPVRQLITPRGAALGDPTHAGIRVAWTRKDCGRDANHRSRDLLLELISQEAPSCTFTELREGRACDIQRQKRKPTLAFGMEDGFVSFDELAS